MTTNVQVPIAREIVELVTTAFKARPAPRISNLHLPPAAAAGSRSGEFCAMELTGGALGLSFVLLDDTLGKLTAVAENLAASQLRGADALAVARWYADPPAALGEIGRTLGFATINALSRELFDRAGYSPGNSPDSVGMIDPMPGEHIGMIGLFPPLIDKIVAAGARLTVAELNPALAGDGAGYSVTLDAARLAGCTKILSTSTVLLNDSLDRMLACCRQAASFAMIGPGAGCLPDPLFARGVTLLGGSWISDGPGFIDALHRGEPWSRFARKFAIRADDYPGLAVLTDRIR